MVDSVNVPPTITTFIKRKDMPSLNDDMPSLSSSDSFTTPSVGVPTNHDNPYIRQQHNPNGTVFIAVGCIVGFILMAFIVFHLFKSMRASRLAKRSWANEQNVEEKMRNSGMYNLTPTGTTGLNTVNTEYQLLVSKLPLLNQQRNKSVFSSLDAGDTSTLYASEAGAATSRNDLTSMFISPTAEVMAHKRNKSGSNLSMLGGSTTNLHPSDPAVATNRHSQIVPNLYLQGETNNSEYALSSKNSDTSLHPQARANPGRANRSAIPSMYLDDLIEK